MNKRDVVLSLLDESIKTPYIPAGFFIHFDPIFHRGQAAIDKHLEYFNFTGMDFIKIQYENRFPLLENIIEPADWSEMPCYGLDFYEDQINIAKGLVDSIGKRALVMMTLYSPFMCAGQSVGKSVLSKHLQENPDLTKVGIEKIAESLMLFVNGCIDAGIDGFYHSTQGSESNRFEGSLIFEECIKPYDLYLMEAINHTCKFNILHVCDYEGGYSDLTPFLDYPGHVVNTSLKLGEKFMTPEEISDIFGRPYMGGLDRHGIINTGSEKEIQSEVKRICQNSPTKFILGADCTLPSNINWQNIRTAIHTAHQLP
ncbi:MAG: uroporphyrinogen decarboxylase family protein [Anaerolineales bacterium]